MRIGKRIEPAEGIETKLGDKEVYEVIYDNGQVGTITTFVSEFDLKIKPALVEIQLTEK